MRLIRAAVKHYRIHRDVTVDFDPKLTVLGGPNEAGKSTLAEAIHRVLFLGHRTTGTMRDGMLSYHGGVPEVELTFAIGADEYRLRKRFNGPSGIAELEGPGGKRWRGDEAEEQLADLLREPAAAAGRGASRVEGRWEHVWVFQGQATDDPINRTANQHETLIQRLQELGGGALVQSARDGEVAKGVEEAYSRTWTEKGNARQNSELSQSQERVAAAMLELRTAEQRVAQLDDAVRRLDAANARLAARGSTALKEQLTQQQWAVRQLDSLEQQLTVAHEKVTRAQVALDEFARRCDAADDAERALAESQQERASRGERVAQALADAQAAQARVDGSDQELRALNEQLRECRNRRIALQKHIDLLRAEAVLAEAGARQQEAQRVREDRGAAAGRLARLPQIDAEACDRLAALELSDAKAEAALEAMAARLELLSSDITVLVDGTALDVGESRVLTTAAELRVGDRTTLRLSPGGGGGVRDAQREATAARQALTDALVDLGVASRHAAEDILRQREALSAQLSTADTTLALPQYAQAESMIAELQARLLALTAERDTELENVQELPDGADLEGVLAGVAEQERQLEDRSAALSAVLDEQRAQSNLRRQEADALRDEDVAANLKVAGLTIQVTALVGELGETALRDVRRRELTGAVALAQLELEGIERNADDLRAAEPAAAVERLDRALQAAEAAEREAETQRAVALDQLKSDGVTDPSRHLADAAAAVARAERAADAEQLRADAIRLLRAEFEAAQEDLAERYAAPLQAKVQEYLRPIFGAGVGVHFAVQQDRFDALALRRARDQFEFGQLSGGTREQVSVAFRLAMVEILAAGFADTLPVVLDDAFAYSDPARLPRVHSMLDRAARSGVQVIVLTCTPADFLGLGGRSVELRPPLLSSPDAAPVAVEHRADERADTSRISEPDFRPSTGEPRGERSLEAELLDALRERGGSMGNQSLREKLGLGVDEYEALKAQVLASGRVRSGKGRGGTLLLVQ